MQDPLLERESLKKMANDEKLFNSQTAIAELKTRLEKLKLSLLYMGGTEEQKSKNLLPDESEQALFLAKLHAAHLLFASVRSVWESVPISITGTGNCLM